MGFWVTQLHLDLRDLSSKKVKLGVNLLGSCQVSRSSFTPTLGTKLSFYKMSLICLSHSERVLPHLKETVTITGASSKAIIAPTMAMIAAVLRSPSLVYNSRSGIHRLGRNCDHGHTTGTIVQRGSPLGSFGEKKGANI